MDAAVNTEKAKALQAALAQIDPDTALNLHTWDAILHAAGAAIDAACGGADHVEPVS